MKSQICVLIQGPVVTYGQGPNISKGGFRSYDCIIANTALLLSSKVTPVLCLWASDIQSEEFYAIDAFYKEHDLSILIIEQPAKKDPDHRYKHHYALYKGLEYVRTNFQCTFLAKIRTDQQINESILGEILQLESSFSDKLLVSELMKKNNFYIGDFIYAGKYETLDLYLKAQVSDNLNQVKYSTIAVDLGTNYYRQLIPTSKMGLIIDYLFLKKKSTKLWEDFINEHMCTLSREAWDSIIWRGKKMSELGITKTFLFVPQNSSTVLEPSKGLSQHIYYIKGKLKRKAKKMVLGLIGR